MTKRVLILGTRGVPARHGGFETFAEGLALYLIGHGWEATVYCQAERDGGVTIDQWRGVRRVEIPVARKGALGTILFDLKATLHAIREPGVALTLGYNTALFSILHRLARQPNVMNMDGIEWRRPKWSRMQRIWLYCNEWLGARLANRLVADHPEIKNHLMRHTASGKITVIPYGADHVTSAPIEPLARYGLAPGGYAILIARPEPENSILEVVRNYVSAKLPLPLAVLGGYHPEENAYHRQVLAAADGNIRFLGSLYDKGVVAALRRHARVYIHGHTVGGTNPSLVEAMGAANPVIAHDNPFNRWVLGEAGLFFHDDQTLQAALALSQSPDVMAERSALIEKRYLEAFQPDTIYHAYETLLLDSGRCANPKVSHG